MEELCEKYSAARYTSLDTLLADCKSGKIEVDGIICAAPHGTHGTIGEAVLEAGMHLLMEKPMTADVDEARHLLLTARQRPSSQAFLLNNTANWQAGTIAAHEAVSAGTLGTIRHVNCILAAPLSWLFEGGDHSSWSRPTGSMVGNGFGWGQFSHTFAWVFRVTGLTPKAVFAVCRPSETTGADLYDVRRDAALPYPPPLNPVCPGSSPASTPSLLLTLIPLAPTAGCDNHMHKRSDHLRLGGRSLPRPWLQGSWHM